MGFELFRFRQSLLIKVKNTLVIGKQTNISSKDYNEVKVSEIRDLRVRTIFKIFSC